MRINFRHGLISYQKDSGSPQYLQASQTLGFVSHMVSPTPTIVAIAHGASDYLIKFDDQVDLAWQITQPTTTYLYWDIDLLTAEVTRGTTIPIPIVSLETPVDPVDDQHWFDLKTNLMMVWSTSRNVWRNKIRLFAGHVLNGNTAQIVQYSEGSTIGLNVPSNPAYIMLDTMLQPLRKSSINGEFLTDEDETRVLSTVGTSGVLVQPVSRVVPVRAAEAIPRMSMVYFSADDTIRLADSNPAMIPNRPPVGICIDAVALGDIGTLVQSGEVTYDQWDWSGHAGKPVYCDSFGQLTLTRPTGMMAFRVGFIKNPTTVLVNVDSETTPQVVSSTTNELVIAGTTPISTTDIVNGIGERVVTISVAPNFFAPFGHQHTIPDVSGLQDSLNQKAYRAHLNAVSEIYTTVDRTSVADVGSGPTLLDLLNGKSDNGHGHLIADVTGLQGELDNRAFVSHTHTMGQVTGLVTALAGKADVAHNHALSTLTDVSVGSAANGQVLTYSSGTWIATTVASSAPALPSSTFTIA